MNENKQEIFTKPSNPQWVFLPLGGAGEIGMNLNLYGFKDAAGKESWIIVDIGVTFSGGRVPGIDVIMADSTFIEQHRENLIAIVLTHGHEDHIGAIAHLWGRLKAPVYATPFTMHLIRGKLREARLDKEVPLHLVEPGKNLNLGPFEIEFVGLNHSIPEPNALAVRTELGCVLHTGDWKIDPEPMLGGDIEEDRLREIGAEGVLAVVGDSTNVFNEGSSGSERTVYDSLMQIFSEARGQRNRIFVTSFASNVARIVNVAKAAEANGRRVALLGRSMLRMAEVAGKTNLLGEIQSFIPIEEAVKLSPDQIVILCTGSQGESNAALSRMAHGEHHIVNIEKGDKILFSSREIPGNEVFIYDLYNALAEGGAEIITAQEAQGLHVSGHPCRAELAQMYKWLRPKALVPVHGEYRHLVEHAAFAESLQIPSCVATNGNVVHLAPNGPPHNTGRVQSGRFYADGKVLVKAGERNAIAARGELAQSGLLSITIMIGKNGHLTPPIKLSLSGAPKLDNEGNNLAQIALTAVEKTLGKMKPHELEKDETIVAKLRQQARQALFHHWGKKPETHIHIMRL